MLLGKANIFSGEYHHTTDEKGRLMLPKSLQDNISESEEKDTIYVVHVPGTQCLTLYCVEKWKDIVRIWTDPSNFRSTAEFMETQRLLFAAQESCKIDKAGRILIPQNLRDRVGLGKTVAILGAYDKIEVWDGPKYIEYLAEATKRQEALMAGMLSAGEGEGRPRYPQW
ncbi:MAG: cell division/cell wall cluster transcriptional repressor MraZ [Deltaproteobacteria bacterium]|jgi:MraZ protein|nr:cell division/cell wall cluster transcriptional repressor MraZ [Deltaproteobacteria bacterium]